MVGDAAGTDGIARCQHVPGPHEDGGEIRVAGSQISSVGDRDGEVSRHLPGIADPAGPGGPYGGPYRHRPVDAPVAGEAPGRSEDRRKAAGDGRSEVPAGGAREGEAGEQDQDQRLRNHVIISSPPASIRTGTVSHETDVEKRIDQHGRCGYFVDLWRPRGFPARYATRLTTWPGCPVSRR